MLQGEAEAKAKARAAFMEHARSRIKEYWARKVKQKSHLVRFYTFMNSN